MAGYCIEGTYAFRPKYRKYKFLNGNYIKEREYEGVGIMPYAPYHNSGSVESESVIGLSGSYDIDSTTENSIQYVFGRFYRAGLKSGP